MKVYKITTLFHDHDDIGPSGIVNHASPGTVMSIEGADIGEWHDDHPLNFSRSRAAEFRRLFPKFDDKLVDKILFAVCNTHDSSELWQHSRQDPDSFREAVRRALKES